MLKYVLDNIIVFERPTGDKLTVSEGIFKEYKKYREQITVSEDYNSSVYWNLDILEDMFYLTKSLIINKSITINCPFTSNTITTSDYFLTTIDNKDIGSSDVICNYYFREDNVILGFSMASGWNGNSMFPIYILSLNKNKIIQIYDTRLNKVNIDIAYYEKLRYISFNLKLPNNNAPLIVTTLYGNNNNLGHDLFNHWTGLFLLDYNNLTSQIDDVIIGPYDPYSASVYFDRKGIPLRVFKDWNVLNARSGRGVCFKYTHVFISEKCSEFVLSHLSFCKSYYKHISHIPTYMTPTTLIDNGRQVVTFILRCGERKPYNQVFLIADTINALVKLFPNVFIILDGFSQPKCSDVIFGSKGIPANVLQDEYIRTASAICRRINTSDSISLINEPSYVCVEWLQISKIAVYTLGSGNVNAGWLCKVPGIEFGVRHIGIYRDMDKVICENSPNVSYLTEGITYENDNPVVDSDTLVNEILKLNILK